MWTYLLIDREQKTITQTAEIPGADSPSRARKEIRAGDILISTVRPNLNAVAMVSPELDGQIASTGFCVLRPDRSKVEGGYLFYFVRTKSFIETLSAVVRGAHYPAVSDRDVKSVGNTVAALI
jgi:type I restriction enzyme, S subunit